MFEGTAACQFFAISYEHKDITFFQIINLNISQFLAGKKAKIFQYFIDVHNFSLLLKHLKNHTFVGLLENNSHR